MNIAMLLYILLSPYNLDNPNVVWKHSLHEIMDTPALGATHCKTQAPNKYKCTIYLMECLRDTPASFRESVIKHEAAHMVDYATDGIGDGHDGQWLQVMKKWKQNPDGISMFDDIPKVCQDDLLNPMNLNFN